MIRSIIFTAALAIAAPAMAQQAAPAPGTTSSATPAAPTSPAATVASIVDSEFPAYDANNDGQLDQSEFSRWMVALKGQEMKATGNTLPAEQVTAWANGAFTSADTDKSVSVSKPELVSYLSGGAG
jgi:hypothetical protein